MGQHKRNPNCILAREGKLPPRKRKLSRRESDRRFRELVAMKFVEAVAPIGSYDYQKELLHTYLKGDF